MSETTPWNQDAPLTPWVIEHRLLAFLHYQTQMDVEQSDGARELAFIEGFVFTPALARFIAGEWDQLDDVQDIIAGYEASGLWVD